MSTCGRHEFLIQTRIEVIFKPLEIFMSRNKRMETLYKLFDPKNDYLILKWDHKFLGSQMIKLGSTPKMGHTSLWIHFFT